VSVDWSQFRDGDRIRVSFEGVWRTSDAVAAEYCYLATGGRYMDVRDGLYPATSAELIERPFTPPDEGKLFRDNRAVLWISLGSRGFRMLRFSHGDVAEGGSARSWSGMQPGWLANIEVLDV
jgi:hypothetical protein